MRPANKNFLWEIVWTVFLAFSAIAIIKQVNYLANKLEEIQSTKNANGNSNQSRVEKDVNYDVEGQEPSTSVQVN